MRKEPRSYAYFALIACPALEHTRVGLAATFPLHITLRGRFTPLPEIDTAELIRVGGSVVWPSSPIHCELTGPIAPTPTMCWYEPRAETCATTFHEIHVALHTALASLVAADHVPGDYQLAGFRPHVTINFGDVDVATDLELPPATAATFFGWAIYEYDGVSPQSPARTIHTTVLADKAITTLNSQK